MIRNYQCSIDLLRVILWQDNESVNLQQLLTLKQNWYNFNHCDFWNNWIVDLQDGEQPEACSIDDEDCEACGS